VPDPSKPRSPSWPECNFELADYDPSLPLHLSITVKLRDRDGMVVKPWQGEHLTRNFAFRPAVHDSRREWDWHSSLNASIGDESGPTRNDLVKDLHRLIRSDGKQNEK
jgi:hypothetical protein